MKHAKSLPLRFNILNTNVFVSVLLRRPWPQPLVRQEKQALERQLKQLRERLAQHTPTVAFQYLFSPFGLHIC